MTREEFIKKYKNDCSYYFDSYYRDCIDDFLTNIYNYHEAQLKAKENDLERQDMIIKCLSMDLDNKEKLLKAKDEEIKELGEIVQQYLIPSKNYDAIIKAKDEEIKRLNNLYADTIKDLGDALIEIERLKEQIKANDELIEVLECRAYHAEGYINDLHNNSKEQQ